MWHYLKAAFWARPRIPSLGAIPLNVLALSGLGLLGFGHPGFWLAGVGLETAYLYALTSSDRFRKVVDAESIEVEETSAEIQLRALVQTLTPPRRQQMEQLEQQCARVLDFHQAAQSEEFVVETNTGALQKIQWLYLKLLIAQQNLESLETPGAREQLQQKIDLLEADLRSPKITPALRESKEATLSIFQRRLENFDRRDQNLQEIASDLARIEAQVALALENTGLRGKPATISTNIDLVSQLLDDSVYGDSGASIAALEQTYGERA